MRTIYIVLIIIHGLLHLLGFAKAYHWLPLKEMTQAIPKPQGLLWLAGATVLIIYAALHATGNRYAWLAGFLAVALSQALIVYFWQDAKWGTLPNLVIIVVSLISYGQYAFQSQVENETAALLSPSSGIYEGIVTTESIEHLPPPVKRWLRRSGMVGRPIITVGKVVQKAEMKLKPDQKNMYPAEAIQYTVMDRPGFIWSVLVKMNPFLFFHGKDKFSDGQGSMLIRLNALLPVVQESGPKIDEGSLQRYLGELVWFPSLALSRHIEWKYLSESTAQATLTYKGASGRGIFHFNDEGDFTRFSAMRFMGNDPEAPRREWILDVQEYATFEGLYIPSLMTATWKLEDSDWTWLQLRIEEVQYNEQAV
jgi:hypothetical protein